MAFIEPIAGKPFVKIADSTEGDVSAIIGITGDAIGSLAISFSESCICAIAGNMLGETFTEANAEVFDAAGEITNMVSGVARSYLEKEGLTIYAAIPTIAYGKGHTFQHILKAPSIVVPFTTDKGDFFIDVCIKVVEEGARKNQVYKVLNIKTDDMTLPLPQPARSIKPPLIPTAQPTTSSIEKKIPVSVKDAKNDEAKLQILKDRLVELIAGRDKIQKELRDNPFMPMERRKKLKKELPWYDEKIRRLKLDINAITMLSKMTQEEPKIIPHFQSHMQK